MIPDQEGQPLEPPKPSMGEIVREPFFKKKKILGVIPRMNKKPQEKIREPALLLMLNTGYIEVRENVSPGKHTIPGEKDIYLLPDRLQTLKYGDQYIKCWVHHEDHPLSFPYVPLQTAQLLRRIVERISMNYRDREETKLFEARGKMWLFILLGVGILLVLLFSIPGSKEFLLGIVQGGGEETARTAVEAVKQNITAKIPT